jgi:hypothetical protein
MSLRAPVVGLAALAALLGGCPAGTGPGGTDAAPGSPDSATTPTDAGASAGTLWIRCLCSDCTGPGGIGVTDVVPTCDAVACNDVAALGALCYATCTRWGLTACASATVMGGDPCCAAACDRCSGPADCAPGTYCHPIGQQCGWECNDGAVDCAGPACLAQPGNVGICEPPPPLTCP